MTQETFSLPSGGEVRLEIRPDTNDHNVAYSIITEDEYRLPRGISGVALDVGAHIGAATVALCELNPDLRVVAIEPVPENVEVLRRNVAPYGDRVTIHPAAAGSEPALAVRYRWQGDEPSYVHRFIGNQHMPAGTPFEAITVPGISLSEIVEQYGYISFMKIDCEGCEQTFLDDPQITMVGKIHGEWHDGPDVELRFDFRHTCHDTPCRHPERMSA